MAIARTEKLSILEWPVISNDHSFSGLMLLPTKAFGICQSCQLDHLV